MKIECLKIEQPIGVFYLAVIKASVLEKICFTKSAKFQYGEMVGGQREANSKNLNEIRDYIQTENAAIPNSIILAANYTMEDDYLTEPGEAWTVDPDQEKEKLFITIPDENMKACAVVDGQHRLKGVLSSGEDMELPCSIFLELPPSLQALVFATINFNQKPVDKSLAYQLFGYQLDESKSSVWTPDLLAVQLSRRFNAEGPFKNRIQLIKNKGKEKQDGWSLSSAAFISGVCSLISSNLNKDKYAINKKTVMGISGRKVLDPASGLPLRRYYIDGNDKAIETVLERYFKAIQDHLWANKDGSDIVFKTVGISAQFRLLKDLLIADASWVTYEGFFQEKLKPISGVDLGGEYFQARSATTSRILNVLKLKLEMIEEEGLDNEVVAACSQN